MARGRGHGKNAPQKSKRGEKSRRGPTPGAHKVILFGKHAVRAALDNPRRRFIRLLATQNTLAELGPLPEDIKVGRNVEIMDARDLANYIPHDAVHQGVVLECHPLDDVHLLDICEGGGDKSVVLVLDQVTDPHNVGAILRSAAAFGADAIVTQDRNSAPESGTLAKSSSGGLEVVPWAQVVNLARALDTLAEAGYWRIGLDGNADIELAEALPTGKICLVLGAEGRGLRPNTAQHCDAVAKLPMTGKVESLNVSNAAAVSLYVAMQRNS
ncbi:MAG: 23S rRNA (guanosine(2251)-2'-O)-methyltransferase RlmB [Sphingomonadales bacterium]|jgi:23S rRNA (guanosine2251-2'-O)-methyltransferase